MPGVKEVQFDGQDMKKVIVIFDSTETSVDAIIEAIESRGDTVTGIME